MTTSPHPSTALLRSTSGPGAAPDDLDLPVTELVCAWLGQRGWTAGIEVVDVCGEPDVRLRVTCPGSGVQVELLCPHPAPARAAPWCAVRITAQQRAVWCGPDPDCPPDELLRFLEALSVGDVAQLAQHYRVLS